MISATENIYVVYWECISGSIDVQKEVRVGFLQGMLIKLIRKVGSQVEVYSGRGNNIYKVSMAEV